MFEKRDDHSHELKIMIRKRFDPQKGVSITTYQPNMPGTYVILFIKFWYADTNAMNVLCNVYHSLGTFPSYFIHIYGSYLISEIGLMKNRCL